MPAIFSAAQLERLATPRSILVADAADDPRDPALLDLALDVHTEVTAVYDAMQNYIGSLLSELLHIGGRPLMERAALRASDLALRPLVRGLMGASHADRAAVLFGLLRASGSDFTYTENADSITITSTRWGPIRQVLPMIAATPDPLAEEYTHATYGRFDDAGYATLSEPGFVTAGYPHLPCTLIVETMLLLVLPLEEWGEPWAVPTLPSDWTQPVVLTVYKDPNNVPDEVYRRAGMARGPKPGSASGNWSLRASAELLPVRRAALLRRAHDDADPRIALHVAATVDHDLMTYEGPLTMFVASLLSSIARTDGEESAVAAMERPARAGMANTLSSWPSLETRQRIELLATFWRAHGSTFWIDETSDSFVLHGAPLGACHRLWWPQPNTSIHRISSTRIRYPTFGGYTPAGGLHLMHHRRSVTCGQSSYPIYSARCHLAHELLPIRQIGHPLWVERHPIDNPLKDTTHLVMKDDRQWPDWVFRRLEEPADG